MNICCMTGRMTKDPQTRYNGESQMAVCTFTIAIDRPTKSGEKKADFPRIICFGKTAENVEKYCKKGSMVGVTGSIQTGSYQNKNGETVYTTDVVANRVDFLSTRGERQEQRPPAEPKQETWEELDADVPF